MNVKNFINGQFQDSVNSEVLDNFNPATAEKIGTIPKSQREDVDQAARFAKEAFKEWSTSSLEFRKNLLLKLAKLIERDLLDFSKWESIDTGKPISLSSHVDIPRSSRNFEFFANYIDEFKNEEFNSTEYGKNLVSYEPLGVVGIISPWNLPLYLLSWKLAPALITGNTIVAKPSEVTPVTAFKLCELIKEAGFPDGVINMVHGLGNEVGEAITEHPLIKAISFTGSTQTGKRIYQNAAKSLKKVSLEMGGKNPNIIFSDCDFEKALKTTMRSSFANQGQICLCGSRIYIEKPIYEKFKNAFVEKTKKIQAGDPLDEKTKMGSMVSKDHFEKVMNCLSIAKNEGASVLCGGERFQLPKPNQNGHFIMPTILENLPNQCKTNQEEIFGPIVTIAPFESIDEVIALSNDTEYGLSASIWSEDLEKAKDVASKINAGTIWINDWLKRDLRTPFGGMKASGLGREGGDWGLRFFLEPKNVCI